MDGILSGSIAVVTGAAQGLGLGIVKQLAQDGATAVIADVQGEKAEAEATKLREQGLDVHAGHLDVTDSGAVTAFLDEVAENHGRLDIMVNNAGASQKVTPTTKLSDQEWHIMERQESECIVNISSINGQNPAALVVSYNVAKAAVIMLTRSLAIDLAAYGVRVNAVCPGPVYTEFNRRVMAQRAETLNVTEEQMVENIRKAVPLGRWGEPADIAQGVVFLCSPAASWVTGEVLTVSGGLAGIGAAPPKRPKK